MPENPVNIKVIIAAGASPADAIKVALPEGLSGFADRHGLNLSHVSRCIHGRQRHRRIRGLLAEALGVEFEWLDALLDERMKQVAA